MGIQYRYQQGKVQVNHNRFLGYTKDAEGNLIIDPEQAETVKRIYHEYLEGSSMDKIAAGLEADGLLTGAGGKRWHTSTINKILQNEKYMGDALLQKTITTDFLTKTRIKIMVLPLNTMLRMTMKPLFQKIYSYWYRKNL